MTLVELIQEYRAEHGLSQRQFATECDLSNGYISMLERGKNPKTGQPITPTLVALQKLATGMNMTLNEMLTKVEDMPVDLGDSTVGTPYNPTHRIPILGRVSAGLPLYAEEHIEGYTFTELNGGNEYFALRVRGDSMNAVKIDDGDILIVRRQDEVEDGEIAVVLVNGEDATVKRFYRSGDMVTLVPQSHNAAHVPQIYDIKKTPVRVLGRVVQNQISF